MKIRDFVESDISSMWEIFKKIIIKGDSYIYEEIENKDFFINNWIANAKAYLAVNNENKILGFYLLRANKVGRASHIANASYMVDPEYQNMGIGKLLAEHSLKMAKELGYLAIQFNIVVSTNIKAVKLWQKLGFNIIGTIPKGFKHISLGYVDTYIMHRYL